MTSWKKSSNLEKEKKCNLIFAPHLISLLYCSPAIHFKKPNQGNLDQKSYIFICLFHYGTVPLVLEALGTVIARPALLFNCFVNFSNSLYFLFFGLQ